MLITFPAVQAGGEGKAEMQADKKMAIVPTGVPGKLAGPVVSSGMITTMELRNPHTVHSKPNLTNFVQTGAVIPPEAWLQVCSRN